MECKWPEWKPNPNLSGEKEKTKREVEKKRLAERGIAAHMDSADIIDR